MINVDKVLIAKPHRSESSYICHIYYPNESTKRNKLKYTFDNASLLQVKPLQQRNENTIFFKCPSANDFICDLNSHIVKVVKDKSVSWFNTHMNVDLIDDYYTTTILYDKEHGDIIRLKCIDKDDDFFKSFVGKNVIINVTFEQLRFFKQKFVVECIIDSIEERTEPCLIKDTDNESEIESIEDIDVPTPSPEDIKSIKEELLNASEKYLDDLSEDHNRIQIKIAEITGIIYKLENTNNIEVISEICDIIENL